MATLTSPTCPRCNGRLRPERDSVSDYLSCLMCGFIQERRQLALAVARAEAEIGYGTPRGRFL
jgi:hypothetical protein